jgi:hypothetical protein
VIRLKDFAAIACLTILAACGKKPETSAAARSAPPPAAPPAAAAPAPQAAPAAQPTAAAVDPELERKRAAMEFALKEDAIKTDARGQWATDAKASSTFATNPDPAASYGVRKATGAPDVERYGDDANSWASKDQDAGIEWLEVSFARAVTPTELRIRQNYNPGAIVRIELYDEGGAAHTAWQGPDPTAYAPGEMAWLTAKVEGAPYKTQRAKITLASNAVPGWNEIDAVQLVGD